MIAWLKQLFAKFALPRPAEGEPSGIAGSVTVELVGVVLVRPRPPDVVAFWSPVLGEWVTIVGDEPVDLPPGGDFFMAWNPWKWMRAAEVTGAEFSKWLSRFPEDRFIEFVRWLFGVDLPNGWAIVPAHAQSLRNALGHFEILRRANVAHGAGWLANPLCLQARGDAIAVARKIGRPTLAQSESWKSVRDTLAANSRNVVESSILRYAAEATIPAARRALGITRNEWQSCLKAVRRSGGKGAAAALSEYVEAGSTEADQAGVVGPGLFLPVETELRFRDVAQRFQKDVSSMLFGQLPRGCVLLWFLDWVLPRRLRARFLIEDGPIIRAAGEPDGPIPGGGFRWKSDEHSGLNGLARPLVAFLWDKPAMEINGRQRKCCRFSELSEPLYGDPAREVVRSMFKNPQREANRFFRENGIPISIGSESEGKSGVLLAFLEISENL